MIPTSMKARRNRKKEVLPTERTPHTTQRENGKQVWLSFELVEALALKKLPGERSLGATAERLLGPIIEDIRRHRPVDDRTRLFRTRTSPAPVKGQIKPKYYPKRRREEPTNA